ncbi:zinc ribbon domain-containing protein [Streptomyces sp. M10]|uniref:zinc ribbon domain-containing protein n=1 Tax=Streptomyces sp. M10 TaxID=412968 RepID=UPI000689DE6C|nr:zinc ribbon domain-containing protein [Streptomyces sp. M10]
MTYETDLAAAKRARRAWGCPCGTDNPPTYDTCHACQHPSWTCATCGTVNPAARSECNECGCATPADQLGDREEGAEMTWEEWIGLQIGPRTVGGGYDHGDDASTYEVLEIEPGPRPTWPVWQMTVRYDRDGRTATHCTGWSADRDRIRNHPRTEGNR